MLSKTDIGNQALSLLGQLPCNDIDTDTNKGPSAIRRWYPQCLDYTLGRIKPRFARWRYIATPSSNNDAAFDYSTTYALPVDYIAMVDDKTDSDINYSYQPSWVIENGKIYSNTTTNIHLMYVRRVLDPSAYTVWFVDALAARLAEMACFEITQNSRLRQEMKAGRVEAFSIAFMEDSNQAPIQNFDDDTWVKARLT